MKILFVVHSLYLGGATKQLALTANSLAERGHDVIVYAYSYDAPSAYPFSDKVKYIPEAKKYASKIKEYLLAPLRIRKIVKEISPDVTIGWRTNAGYMVALATLCSSYKSLLCERSDPYMEDSLFLHIAKWICNLNDGGIFQTEGARQYYKMLAGKSIVIPNPYSYDGCKVPFVPIDERKKEISIVGRLFIKQKRQDVAIKAFKLFSEKHPDYRLKVYGDGLDMQNLKELAKKEGIEDLVDFEGAVDGVILKISQSRLMLLSSDYEGIPNVVLEAFTAKTPVVVTDCSPGGAHTLIKNGYNGFIVPRGDIKAMAEKMEVLVCDVDLSMKFIERSSDRISEFADSKIFDSWEKFLSNKVLNR